MDKNLYILAELDNNTQELIKIYEKIIIDNGLTGKQTKGIPYHITLSSYSPEYENELIDLLEGIKQNFEPIKIAYSGFGLFGLNVLYLNPNMSLKLLELYNYTKGNSKNSENDLSAHTTLLIDEPENILKILPKMVEINERINGEIKYISLYEFFPTRFIKRIKLEK